MGTVRGRRYEWFDAGTRGVTADLGVVEEAAHMTKDMFDAVLLPLLGVRNFALLAIATPGDEFNHYSQLMDRTDDNGDPLFKTIRLGLVCPECLAKDVRDVCEHRLDLLPPWKSQTNLNRIGKVLDGDKELFARENLGIILTNTEYFIKREWVRDLQQRPRYNHSAPPPLLFCAIDPSGGGDQSSYAIVTTALTQGQCVVSI